MAIINNTIKNVKSYKGGNFTQTFFTNKSNENNMFDTKRPVGRRHVHSTKRTNNQQSKERKGWSMRINRGYSTDQN